jgi:hypothetical protein
MLWPLAREQILPVRAKNTMPCCALAIFDWLSKWIEEVRSVVFTKRSHQCSITKYRPAVFSGNFSNT